MPPRKKSALGRITPMAKRLRIKRGKETAEERVTRLEYTRFRATLFRAAETPEERQQRLEKQRIRAAIYRGRQRQAKETGAAPNGHCVSSTGKRKKASVSKRASGKTCTPIGIKRGKETAEERARRLEYTRLRATLCRALETPEERQRRLEKQRIRSANYRERLRRGEETGAASNGHSVSSTGKQRKASVCKHASGRTCTPIELPVPDLGGVEITSIKDEMSAITFIDCDSKFEDASIFSAETFAHCAEKVRDTSTFITPPILCEGIFTDISTPAASPLIDCEERLVDTSVLDDKNKLQTVLIVNPKVEPKESCEIEIDESPLLRTETPPLIKSEEPAIKTEDLNVTEVDEPPPKSASNCIFEECFGHRNGIRMLQLLTETYADKEHSHMKILDESHNFVISVVSPFMQRVGEKLTQSSEIVFVSSVTSLDPMGCRVVVMMTNSFAGGLPLALIVTSPGAAEALIDGVRMVRALLSETAFGGRGPKGPIVFMVGGDDRTECLALLTVFPVARLLFCQSQMIVSTRSSIGERYFNVAPSHKPVLLYMFESLVYEPDVDIFEQKVNEMLDHSITLLYPGFRYHLKELLEEQKSWATCHRANFITRGQNTNTLCAAAIQVIRNVLRPIEILSPVHLLNVLMEDYQQIYVDKLVAAANFRPPSYLQSKEEVLRKMCDSLVHSESEGKVLDSDHERVYAVDLEIGLCECVAGANGRICEHLFVAAKNSCNLFLTLPEKEHERKNCIYIATGEYSLDENCGRRLQEKVAIDQVVKNLSSDDEGVDVVDREPIFVNVDDDDDEIKAEWNECAVEDVDPEIIAREWWSDVAEQTSDECVIDGLDSMLADLKMKVAENPCLLASLNRMISSYQKINTTTTALESAMFYFAK